MGITGFMDEDTYKSVVENVALPDGLVFGLPVVYDTDSEDLKPGMTALMKDGDRPIALLEFTDKYTPDKPLECLKCYGTSEIEHPGSLMVATERGKYYMGTKVTGLNLPVRDFPCKTPAEVRETLPDDIPGTVRYKTYEVLKEETKNDRTRWEYLPYSMHMAGPREAVQHMMIRKNYGCTHFIIGRDMA